MAYVDDIDMQPLLDGADDERLLAALYMRIARKSVRLHRPTNDCFRAYFLAWEAVEILNGDGFESMLEQEFSLEQYRDAFAAVGMPRVTPIFDRVIALIPGELRNSDRLDDLLVFSRNLFEPLKNLL